jgi:hypothetical protein
VEERGQQIGGGEIFHITRLGSLCCNSVFIPHTAWNCTDHMYQNSVATVMTDVFHKNEINLLRKFAKIMRIFDEVDESKNRGII